VPDHVGGEGEDHVVGGVGHGVGDAALAALLLTIEQNITYAPGGTMLRKDTGQLHDQSGSRAVVIRAGVVDAVEMRSHDHRLGGVIRAGLRGHDVVIRDAVVDEGLEDDGKAEGLQGVVDVVPRQIVLRPETAVVAEASVEQVLVIVLIRRDVDVARNGHAGGRGGGGGQAYGRQCQRGETYRSRRSNAYGGILMGHGSDHSAGERRQTASSYNES